MANGDEAVLPMPSSAGPNLTALQQPQMDPQKKMFLAQLIQRMGPDAFKALMPQPAAQQPSVQPTQQPASIQAPVPAQMETKFDPMSNVGSLPAPAAQQPGPTPYQTPSGSSELLAKLDPKHASTFMGIQGVNQFISQSFQKRDEKQKAEAANAAQALMSALESAKTTGDFSPAQHILENNEQLFNKVYKGWLQKSKDAQKEAQKPSKKDKPPDPEIQGFEQGLAQYLGKGGANQQGAPKPPQSLQGKSGAQYMIPQAPPAQAIAQQNQSQTMQQQRQAPGQQVLTPEERVKLQEANLRLQVAQLDVQKAQAELDKAKVNDQANTKLYQDRLTQMHDEYTDQLLKKDATIGDLRVKLQERMGPKSSKPKTMPEADVRKWSAAGQISDYLDKVIKEKRGFTAEDSGFLAGLLPTAGASATAKGLPKTWMNRLFAGPQDVKTFKENFDSYKSSLKAGFDKTYPGWDKTSGGSGDSKDQSQDFGPAGDKPEGASGTLPDGTKVIVKGGRIVKNG